MIRAHGGRLVNRYADDAERAAILDGIETLPVLELNRRETARPGIADNVG